MNTHREIRVGTFVFVQISLYHERQQFGYKICVGSLVCTRRITPGKVGPPSITSFGRGRRTSLRIGLERAQREMVGRKVISNIRKFIEGDAEVRYLYIH